MKCTALRKAAVSQEYHNCQMAAPDEKFGMWVGQLAAEACSGSFMMLQIEVSEYQPSVHSQQGDGCTPSVRRPGRSSTNGSPDASSSCSACRLYFNTPATGDGSVLAAVRCCCGANCC